MGVGGWGASVFLRKLSGQALKTSSSWLFLPYLTIYASQIASLFQQIDG